MDNTNQGLIVNNTKQVIVMRKDLNMRRGKQIAQGCHASMKVILETQITRTNVGEIVLAPPQATLEWLDGIFTKICVSVNSEAELDALYETARQLGIPCSMIVDSGLTEFNGVPTKTCIAIGPDYNERVDLVTKGLPLL